MSKKILIGLAPLLAIAAFAVMPAMASAATTAYGTCEPGAPETHPPCLEGEKNLTAFAELSLSLAANGNLCTSELAMPTAFVAQNGAEIHESTKITVTGCPRARAKVAQITGAQKLKAALHACRRQHKKNKRKRTACEALAKRRFGP